MPTWKPLDRARSLRQLALAIVLPVLLATGSVFAISSTAVAADLYDDPPVYRGSAYDDPRYADIYGRSPPIPRAYVYRHDDRDTYRSEYRGDYRGDNRADADRCPSKAEISRHLEADGWRAFRNPRVIDRDTAAVDADRPNGRPFRLEVDRCSGDVLAARPLELPRYGADTRRYDADEYGDRRRY